MLAQALDVLAVTILEQRLGGLREQYLRESLAGRPPGPEYWSEGEARIWQELKDNFYSPEVRQLVQPRPALRSEAEAFAKRTQKLAEYALLSTHRKLAELPFVGQPADRDESWNS